MFNKIERFVCMESTFKGDSHVIRTDERVVPLGDKNVPLRVFSLKGSF